MEKAVSEHIYDFKNYQRLNSRTPSRTDRKLLALSIKIDRGLDPKMHYRHRFSRDLFSHAIIDPLFIF